MSDNESVVVEQIIRSLSFEVVAIPGESQKVVSSSTSKATPLNVKIRVKKKHEGGLQHGVLAIPVKDPDEVPQRIRLVSSDQTIMSFNAVMEDVDFDKSRVRKPNLPNIDPYTSSTTEACQSDAALNNKSLLSKVEDDSTKKRDIFGRCKPGGCLDPPFGEDKYSYEPSKQKPKTQIEDIPERKRTSSIFSNKLFKKIKKSITDKTDVNTCESESKKSVISLYETESLQTSAYSNSIITYPSPSNGSDDKVIQDRQKSPRNSATRKSNESDTGSLYIVPKKTRASLEKEEAKLKSKRDDTNLSKELGNIGDVGKLGDVEKIDPSALNDLDEEEAEYTIQKQFDVTDTIDETNYQEKLDVSLETEHEISGDRVDSALESKQDDNDTSGVKTGLIAAGVTATSAGIAATLLADLKDNDKTTYDDTSVDKLSGEYDDTSLDKLSGEDSEINTLESKQDDNDTSGVKTGLIAAGVAATSAGIAATLLADLKDNDKTTYDETSVDKLSGEYDDTSLDKLSGDDNEINEMINDDLNDTGNTINEAATRNITDDKTKHGSGIDDENQLSTNTIDYNYSVENKFEGINTENGKVLSKTDSDQIAQDYTEGIEDDTNELLDEAEDFETDKHFSNDDENENKLFSDDLSNSREFENEISCLDTSDQIDKQVSKSDKVEDIIHAKTVVITDPNYDDSENKLFSDDLSDIREFENEISSLDTSDQLDKQVSKSDMVEDIIHAKTVVFTDLLTKDDRESDSEFQPLLTKDENIGEYDKDNISIRDNGDSISKNNEDILSVSKRQKDLQDMLQKGKEFLDIDGNRENDEIQSELKREDAFDYKDMDMNQSKKIDNYGQRNISNDVIKTDISPDRLGDIDDLSKSHQLKPGSGSESAENLKNKTDQSNVVDVNKDDESIADKIKDDFQSLKKIKKAADGDKQKKRKESTEQLKTKIDLGFHTYINENNELTLKSFDSKTPPSRYPKDSIIVTNCDLKDPFELKVPFGTEQYLWIQIKDNENLSQILPGTTKSSKISITGKTQKPKLHKINEQMNSAAKNATRAVKLINKDIVKAQMKDIYCTYENELVPLQQSLTRLKQDVDVLILQQKTIRNNLLPKRLKIQGNRKCGCVKKL